MRREELTRLPHGTYSLEPSTIPAGAVALHRLRVRATAGDLRTPAIVSHASAATVHGLPLWGVRLDRVHVLRHPPASGSVSARLRLHVARIADDGIAVVEGLLVTTATRTVVVVATMVPFESAVVTGEFRDHRWEVARWTWDDLSRPRVVGERVRRPFVLGRR